MTDNKVSKTSLPQPSLEGREEGELQKQVLCLQALLEDSSDIVAAIDPSYSLLAFNQRYQEAFFARYGVEAKVGLNLKEELVPKKFQKDLSLWREALEGKKVEQSGPSAGGGEEWIKGIYKPVHGNSGQPIGAFFIGKNAEPDKNNQLASLQGFMLLADAMPQVVWTADPDGHRDYINSWASHYTGASKKELLEGGWNNYIHPDDTDQYKAKFQFFIDSEEGFELEYRLRGKDGSYRWHLGKAIPVLNKEKIIIKFIGTATDIHEHKNLLNQYGLKAREMEQTMEAIPQVVWTTDSNGQALYFNRQWYQYTGSQEEKSLNSGWMDLIHPDDIQKTMKTWGRSIETGKDYYIEYRLRRADGEYHWFIAKAVPLRNSDGTIVRWFGTCTDIQDQVLQRDELDRKNSKLFQINRYLEDFVHAVAHDLRSPVAGLKLSFELLPQVDEAKQGKIMKGCQTYLDRLDNTLKGLVQLIEVQEESHQQYYEPLDIHQVIDEVVVDLQPKLMDAGAAVKFKKLEWRTIVYPKPYIYNILRNIIRYVLRFRDPSSRIIFNISTRQTEEGMMVLEIKDNGPGINLDKESKNLFKPFSHINKGSDQQGMGLAIVKHMVEKNGGKIEVKSTLGKGTKFRLFLKEYANKV